MHRFWNIIIEPLFKEIKPKYIIEIGSFTGINTKNLLNYCKQYNSKLTSIDPKPHFNVTKFKNEFYGNFEMIEDISLNCLPHLNNYDTILIDGDHNWYTVYNELKLIEKKFNQKTFPFILLHDISWPYGRRDAYYCPTNIPKNFLNKYEKLGVAPNQKELLKNGGINPTINHAITEYTDRNGVLTAIENFLNETKLNLSFYKINGFNGMGIIYAKNKSTYDLINKTVYKSNIGEIVEKQFYIELIKKDIQLNNKNKEIEKLKKLNKTIK